MDLYICRPFCSPNYHIVTDDIFICKSLISIHGRYASPDVAENCMKIIAERLSNSVYAVSFAGKRIETSHVLQELDRIITESTVYSEEILPLHGGAVSYDGNVSVFLGATTTGKTTLMSFLTSHQIQYMADDCVFIDRKSLCVYPNPRPIHLRKGGLDVLKALGIEPAGIRYVSDRLFCRYTYTPENIAPKEAPLQNIFFIERSSENSLRNLSFSDSFPLLICSPITDQKLTNDYIQLLSRITQKSCFYLKYKDMSYVEALIKDTDFFSTPTC